MGIGDLFGAVKLIAGTKKRLDKQKQWRKELAALPDGEFEEKFFHVASEASPYFKSVPIEPHSEWASFASRLRLPKQVRSYYERCNGLKSIEGELLFSTFGIDCLQTTANSSPSLIAGIESFWSEHGNDATKENHLGVLESDDLAGLITNEFSMELPRESLSNMLILERIEDDAASLLVIEPINGLLAGQVLRVESGIATRYESFRAWCAFNVSTLVNFSEIKG